MQTWWGPSKSTFKCFFSNSKVQIFLFFPVLLGLAAGGTPGTRGDTGNGQPFPGTVGERLAVPWPFPSRSRWEERLGDVPPILGDVPGTSPSRPPKRERLGNVSPGVPKFPKHGNAGNGSSRGGNASPWNTYSKR